MNPEVFVDPSLKALLAKNQEQDIRPIISDWLRDHDAYAVADAVLKCETPDAVNAVILRVGARSVLHAIAASGELDQMFANYGVEYHDGKLVPLAGKSKKGN